MPSNQPPKSAYRMTTTGGRPPKPPGEALTEQVSLKLTAHQLRVIDAMIHLDKATINPAQNRQDFLRGLIRAEYVQRVKQGMKQVER